MVFVRKIILLSVFFVILIISIVIFSVFYEKIFKTKQIIIQPSVEIRSEVVLEEESELSEIAQEEVVIEGQGMETEKISMVARKMPFLFNIFGKATIAPNLFLDGKGANIDSPEFFETSDYRDTLLLVSGKGNNIVEVWKYPFSGNEQKSLRRDTLPNGLAVDQRRDWLLVGDSEETKIEIYSLPDLNRIKTIGKEKIESGETNLDVYDKSDGSSVYFVSESHKIRGFDADSGKQLVSFEPMVSSIEELVVDDYYGAIYIPDEDGVKSMFYRGGAVTAYNLAGNKYLKNGVNVFGSGVFQGDAEGATIYKCLDEKNQDMGHGFLIFIDQAGSGNNALEFFNRETWKHLGTLRLSGVSMSDGVASIQTVFPEYPLGLLAITNADKTTALVSWSKIFEAAGLSCEESF